MKLTAKENSIIGRHSGSRNIDIKKSSTTIFHLHASKLSTPFKHDFNMTKTMGTSRDISKQIYGLKKENNDLLKTLKKRKNIFKSELESHKIIVRTLNKALTLALPIVITHGDPILKEKLKKALSNKSTIEEKNESTESEFKELQIKLTERELEMNFIRQEIEMLKGENNRLSKYIKNIKTTDKSNIIPSFIKSMTIDH